ncbi:MAG: threonine ammonia-lyase, partial [Candidatus Thorarchaeota archaeon]|nr:threonine ammonia-lyase [Candidatus Thorarchaeota archaeon]
GLAAFQHGRINVKGNIAVAVLSGGNIDMSLMSRVVEKELFRLGRSVRVRGVISDRVGSMNKALGIVAESGVSIMEIEQDRFDPDIAPNKMELKLILEVPDESAVDRMLKLFERAGLKFEVYED